MKKLGKYDLQEQLGKGGFGTVYRAVDSLQREVAIKVLKPGWEDDPDVVSRFRQEALSAGKLFHPHIATILDLDQDEGRFYIVMRYIAGKSLAQMIRDRGALPWEEVLQVFQDVADALDYAHKQGMVHRDVKPANIIISPKEGAVITDFGLVKAATSSGMSTTGVMLGTPNYIAPEVWQGETATPATDVYSLACVVFEMLTGKVLFGGSTTPQIMKKHFDPIVLPETWPAGTPEGIREVLQQALEKEPGQRFGSMKQLAAAVSTISAQKTVNKPVVEVSKPPTIPALAVDLPVSTKQPPLPRPPQMQAVLPVVNAPGSRKKWSGLAITSFILGIFCLFPLPFFIYVFPIPAIILSAVSLGQFKKIKMFRGKGFAVMGLILGIACFLYVVLNYFFYF